MNIVQEFFGSLPTFRTVNIAGLDFDIVSLSTEKAEELGACTSLSEMYCLAADNGLAFDREYISEGDKALDIPKFWKKKELTQVIGGELPIKEQVGEAVCSISGVAEIIGKQASLEQSIETVDEDEVTKQLNAQNAVQ